jgi:hypothetical protein
MRFVIVIKTSPTTDGPNVRPSYRSIYPRPEWNSNAGIRVQVVEEIRSRTSGHTLDKTALPDLIVLSFRDLLFNESLFF